MLAGERGPAVRLAMQVLVAMGDVARAERLIPIKSAHIDSLPVPRQRRPGLRGAPRQRWRTGRCADNAERLVARPAASGPGPAAAGRARSGQASDGRLRRAWAASPPGPARRISCRSARRSASTSPGPSPMPSSSPTRCSARGPAGTATSSTSAPRSPDGCRSPGCTWTTSAGQASYFALRAFARRRSASTSSTPCLATWWARPPDLGLRRWWVCPPA